MVRTIKDQRDFDSLLCFGVFYDEIDIAKMEEKHGKTQNKVEIWSDLEGLAKKKRLLDEEYDKKAMKLGSKLLKMEKKYGKIDYWEGH